jgi:prevent-host-death family protein
MGKNNHMKEQATIQTLKTLTATKAKSSFSAVLSKASYKGERIVIKKLARPTAVILSYEDFQHLADLEDRFESALLTKSLKEERFLTLDEVTKRLGL